MGPETGSRTLDKLDFILFLLVLLLRVSLRILALVRHLLWLYHRFYIYFFHQALFCGVHHKVLPTISFMSYLGIKFIMFLLYWMHSITSFLLCFLFELCQGLLFWPQIFYRLYNPTANGWSVWKILTDPEDVMSTRIKMKNLPSAGIIRPLWSKFLVFAGYQVHGAYAHLHQHNKKRLQMPSQTQQDHHSHEFGILFVFRFHISIFWHCLLSLPIATFADGSPSSQSWWYTWSHSADLAYLCLLHSPTKACLCRRRRHHHRRTILTNTN